MTIGCYTNIKRFAVHDGPGIRTTLFLKGCTLACKWCHNPETVRSNPELAVHYNLCRFCGDCAAVCPNHGIGQNEHRFERGKCTACGKCVRTCKFNALELFGKHITPEEAARLLLEDRIFYENGGGVTLSGGEPLRQADFCGELLKLIHGEHISCAVDTCGNVPWDAFGKVLPYADLFLYDFKVADSGKHKTFTGCGNELILENLKRLDGTGKTIEIRMIQIPRWNMDKTDLEAAGDFLASLNHLSAVRLLAYHALSHSKYRAVGRPDTMPEETSPDADMLARSAEILRRKGLSVMVP